MGLTAKTTSSILLCFRRGRRKDIFSQIIFFHSYVANRLILLKTHISMDGLPQIRDERIICETRKVRFAGYLHITSCAPILLYLSYLFIGHNYSYVLLTGSPYFFLGVEMSFQQIIV